MTTKSLLEEIDAFLARDDVKVSATRFGIEVMGDGSFLRMVRRGRKVTLETADKCRRFMAEYRAPEQDNETKHGVAA